MWRSVALMLCLGLAGCQMALPFGGDKSTPAATSPAQATVTAKPGAIAGGAVTATPLTSKPAAATPAVVPPAKAGAAIPAGTIKGTPQGAGTKPAPPKSEAPKPETAKSETAKPEVAKAETPADEAETAPPKSAPQLACEAGGGLWSEAGKKGVKTCVQRTRDAGKSCKREGDCQGFCLARSRSCAPVTPLFGCNDILQADGRQVTLCID